MTKKTLQQADEEYLTKLGLTEKDLDEIYSEALLSNEVDEHLEFVADLYIEKSKDKIKSIIRDAFEYSIRNVLWKTEALISDDIPDDNINEDVSSEDIDEDDYSE